MAATPPRHRRRLLRLINHMKIYAFSDQHGKLDFQLPEADLILCAGDICPDFAPGEHVGSYMQERWLEHKWLPWKGDANVLATFGNHDFVYSRLIPASIKVDEAIEFNGLKIWFSPWSNTFGAWAWMAPPPQLEEVYAQIPADTDIIVSHQPPYGYGDQVAERYRFSTSDVENDGHVGSKELLATINRIHPKAIICGHIHSGFGRYRHGNTDIYNVALVNEEYQRINEPVEIPL